MLVLENVGDTSTVALYGLHHGNCFNWATGLALPPGNPLCNDLAALAAANPAAPCAAVFTRLQHVLPAIVFDHTFQPMAQSMDTGAWYMCVFMIGNNFMGGEEGREVHFARLCQDGFFGRPAANVDYLTRCQYNPVQDRWYSHNPNSELLTEYVHGYYMFFVKRPIMAKKATVAAKKGVSTFDRSKINPAFFKKTSAE
ncbi:hypothetical protein [Janthinobacterium sp. B9-8]|uniref:hypothetical protein n=1 Tax=Janthinobacterium sp. B9-8 TaxID=1236179 RepID=UPI00061CE547|nr:hypothetical protein [Janthinobacterium sp. B9-8]AMC34715.1 hypothetical protein VN23_08890 [Janthinobacterium sp. B9-8]